MGESGEFFPPYPLYNFVSFYCFQEHAEGYIFVFPLYTIFPLVFSRKIFRLILRLTMIDIKKVNAFCSDGRVYAAIRNRFFRVICF